MNAMKDEILKMSRDQLIDFLIENWTDFVKNLKPGKERDFWKSEKYHPTEMLRGVAISLIEEA